MPFLPPKNNNNKRKERKMPLLFSSPKYGVSIWCTPHICWVTHTLVAPTMCGAHLCVRDPAYMPGIRYNFDIIFLYQSIVP